MKKLGLKQKQTILAEWLRTIWAFVPRKHGQAHLGYITFFMLNSAEQKISTAQKN